MRRMASWIALSTTHNTLAPLSCTSFCTHLTFTSPSTNFTTKCRLCNYNWSCSYLLHCSHLECWHNITKSHLCSTHIWYWLKVTTIHPSIVTSSLICNLKLVSLVLVDNNKCCHCWIRAWSIKSINLHLDNTTNLRKHTLVLKCTHA